jgi:hypothetical protein
VSPSVYSQAQVLIVVTLAETIKHITRWMFSSCPGWMFRIDVGGKLLTNQLKRLLSFRQWDLMAETHIVNRIREECCYVTNDWKKDLERAR